MLRAHYGPHESVGVHDHSGHPTVYVYLNDAGAVRFVHEPEGLALTRPPTHAGSFRISPGRVERHIVTNLSGEPSEYLRVELKQIPLGTLKQEFRSAAPQHLQPGITVEYANPELRIDRVVCEGSSPCSLAAKEAPSVVVAFTPARLRVAGKSQTLTEASPVAWLQNGEAASVRASKHTDVGLVHLLRIYLLKH